jgi:hypothetical protein
MKIEIKLKCRANVRHKRSYCNIDYANHTAPTAETTVLRTDGHLSELKSYIRRIKMSP